ARRLEGAKIRIRRIERFSGLLLSLREIVGDILTAEIPVRLVEDHIGEISGPEAVEQRSDYPLGLAATNPEAPRRGARLAARRVAGKDRLSRRVLRAGIDLLQRRDVGFGETLVRLAGFANDTGLAEMALTGFVEKAVLAVARFERRIGHHRELFGRNPAVRRRGESLIGPDRIG